MTGNARVEPVAGSDLRVLHVLDTVTPTGGAEISTVQTLIGLASLGVSQALLTLKPATDPTAVNSLKAAGIDLYQARGAGLVQSVLAVRKAIRDFSPSLVSATLYESNRAARLACLDGRVPVLVALVNTPYAAAARAAAPSPLRLRVLALVEGLLARRCTSAFHALTPALAREAVLRLRVPQRQIHVVSRGRSRLLLGVPSAARRAKVRKALAIPPDATIFLNVARQEPQKGHLLLLDAFDRAALMLKSAHLVIAGREGRSTEALLDHVDSSPVRDRIHILGARADVPDLLAASDVFVFSSLWEGFGGAVAEAMALSLPVVAFDVPAVAETLGGCGVLVPAGDSQALAAALVDLVEDRNRMRDMGLAGQRRFDDCFEIGEVLPDMINMYNAVVEAHKRP